MHSNQFNSQGVLPGLRVTIYDEVEGTTTDLLFRQFPVRIGRNTLNELVLDHQYVSQWHALIDYSEGVLRVQQVGSTNSARVNDRKLQANEAVALGGTETIRIVPFRIQLQLVTLPAGITNPRYQDHSIVQAAAQVAASDPRGAEQVALNVLERLSERMLGYKLSDPQQLATFGAALESSTDVFVRCFVALSRGHQQMREALDIRVLGGEGDNPVESAAEAGELAKMIFSGDQRYVQFLEQAFKNMMIHQVALLNGMMAGVRTLLDKISPAAMMKEATRRTRSPSFKQVWQVFEETHQDLAEEDNETFETIFGSQFDKAYTTVATSGQRQPRKRKRRDRTER